MASNLVKLKRSAVAGKTPTTVALELGELALNTYDGYIYLKKSDGITEEIVRFTPNELYAQSVVLDTFIGDDTTIGFTLSIAPQADQYSVITINGVVQHTDAYSVTGKSLIFSEAPAFNDSIEVRTLRLQSATATFRDYYTFTFQPTTSTTTFSGEDLYGSTLSYEQGKLFVYLNGVLLTPGLDYEASDTQSVVLEESVSSGSTVVIQSFGTANLMDWDAIKPNAVELTSSTAGQTVDTFLATDYRTAKYIISMSHASAGYHSEEVLLLHDGTNVYLTSYAQIWTNASLGNISSSIQSGTVKLTVSPINTFTTIKVQRITVSA
jgi:hypothetical protein